MTVFLLQYRTKTLHLDESTQFGTPNNDFVHVLSSLGQDNGRVLLVLRHRPY
jgi:hypothetical protein